MVSFDVERSRLRELPMAFMISMDAGSSLLFCDFSFRRDFEYGHAMFAAAAFSLVSKGDGV